MSGGAGTSPRRALLKPLWLLLCLVLLAGLGHIYYWEVWRAGPETFRWVHEGVRYELLQPRMLGVMLAAPWFLAVLAWSLADLPWQQSFLTVLLRIGFVACLGLALARPVKSADSDKIATVFLVDVSDSVTENAIGDARKLVEQGFAKRRKEDLVRVVSFAVRPKLLKNRRGPDDAVLAPKNIGRHGRGKKVSTRSRLESEAPGSGSNLQAALQLAYGLFPPGYLRRVVLISDGVQTDGDVLAEAERAREHGVRVHAIPYKRKPPAEVAIRSVRLPERVRLGETFQVRAEVYATRATTLKMRCYQGETLNGLEPLKTQKLKPGVNWVNFKSVVRVAGEVTYALDVVDLKEDRFGANNRFSVTVDVPGRPQVLYIEGNPRYAGPLSRALTAQQYDVDVRSAAGFPGTLKELERYDFVVVSDVAKEQFGAQAQQLVREYVRDLGGGFLFAGGENGYGLGGWQRTPMARLLPVRMDVERANKIPSVAMVLVIDHSGSMSGLPMEMAKKAAKATLGVLENDDRIEVIAFDDRAHRAVKMQPARNRSRIRGLISRIQPGGGTNIFPALDAAYNALSVTDARKKHAILLTDGRAPAGGIRELVSQMIAEAMTVTTVGLGADVDDALLKMIADVGGGRYHQASEPNSLPRIFTKETEMIARAAAVEEWFPVVQTGYANFLRRIDTRSAPFLHGYVSTKMKPAPAVELLASEDTAEPILARWRVGTGWVLAWTSDLKTRWAVEWVGWRGWEKFWGQLVREHMRQKHRRELDMQVHMSGGVLRASVDAFTADERFDNKLVSRLHIIGPQPGGSKREVKMQQIAPGRYQAETTIDAYGSFLLRGEHFREREDGELQLIAKSSSSIANPYPREYASFKTDVQTLERAAMTTRGRFDPKSLAVAFDPEGEKIKYHENLWPACVAAALLAFLLDLLLRRVRLFDRRFRRRSENRRPLYVA